MRSILEGGFHFLTMEVTLPLQAVSATRTAALAEDCLARGGRACGEEGSDCE
jgi:hypothetical protein